MEHLIRPLNPRLSRLCLAMFVATTTAACGFPKTGPAPGPVRADQATAARQRWASTTQTQLEEGRRLFIEKCDGCHGYPDLSAIAEPRWEGVMEKMGPKSDLTQEQSTQVLRFILVARQ